MNTSYSNLPTADRTIQHIMLADDDEDDCLLFKDALAELHVSTQLTIIHNGEHLMQLLYKTGRLPDLLFLDLNMPRKNGIACLAEIKCSEVLKNIPVIILSTSFEQDIVALLYKKGAQHCIRKPNEFSKLKEVIYQAITTIKENTAQPSIKEFVLTSDFKTLVNSNNYI